MLLGTWPSACYQRVDVLSQLLDTAAVSKHETGTVPKQATCALQFMVDFALRGGEGCYTSANISHFVGPWEVGGPSPNQQASDLYHNFEPAGQDCHRGFRTSGNF